MERILNIYYNHEIEINKKLAVTYLVHNMEDY